MTGVEFRVSVTGTNAVANKLRPLAAGMPRPVGEAVYRWAQDTRKVLKSTPYPAKRPKQKYKRTGRLANGWAVERGSGAAVAIVNSARGRDGHYTRYVVGDGKGKGQAWMHKGRWWIARTVTDGRRAELRRSVRQAIAEATR